jgi:hypothetical protein
MKSIAFRVVKNDPASLTRVLIYVIDSGKCHADQLEIRASFDYRPRKRPIAQQEDVSVTDILDQVGIAQASCVGDKKVMTALFKQILRALIAASDCPMGSIILIFMKLPCYI